MATTQHQGKIADLTVEAQVSRVFAWRRGFNAMHLIDIGIRFGLFKAFAKTPDATAQEVAARLRLHAPYVEVWCTTAYSFELLDAREGQEISTRSIRERDPGQSGAPLLSGWLRATGDAVCDGGLPLGGRSFSHGIHRSVPRAQP